MRLFRTKPAPGINFHDHDYFVFLGTRRFRWDDRTSRWTTSREADSPTLVVLALPLVAQNPVQVLNQLVDTFWLGRLNEEEVAAVGVGGFYLLRYEQMFSNAAEEAAGTAAD